jgi:hypothetical protein
LERGSVKGQAQPFFADTQFQSAAWSGR